MHITSFIASDRPMTKVISLSEEPYGTLKKSKRANESFSDVVILNWCRTGAIVTSSASVADKIFENTLRVSLASKETHPWLVSRNALIHSNKRQKQ